MGSEVQAVAPGRGDAVEKRILELQDYWTKELQEEVSILPMGYVSNPTEVGLWVGGTFITSYKRLDEIENYLETYFMVKGE